MASTCMVISRRISTSSVCYGKRNFRKFLLYNKRGNRAYKEAQRKNPDFDVPIDKRGVRDTGMKIENEYIKIPEMIPEIIVPSLKDFHLRPYVSYQTENIVRREFTAKDLFNIVYAEKIKTDFETNKLGPNGEPIQPNAYEKLTPEDAKRMADQTGSDLFTEYKYCRKW